MASRVGSIIFVFLDAYTSSCARSYLDANCMEPLSVPSVPCVVDSWNVSCGVGRERNFMLISVPERGPLAFWYVFAVTARPIATRRMMISGEMHYNDTK